MRKTRRILQRNLNFHKNIKVNQLSQIKYCTVYIIYYTKNLKILVNFRDFIKQRYGRNELQRYSTEAITETSE